MLYDLYVTSLFIAFCGAIIASIFGVSAGGSALLLLPMLIFLGLPPQEAIATAMLGYMGLNIVAAREFYKAGKLDVSLGLPGLVLGTAGTIVGVLTLPQISGDVLSKTIGVFILIIVGILAFGKDIGLKERTVPQSRRPIGYILFFFMGLYLAIIMAGTSIIASYILVLCFGQTYLQSAGTRKLIFLGTNSVASTIFFFQGLINFPFMIAIFFGNAIGSYIGVHLALRKGELWVKWLFLIVTTVSGLKLLL